MSSSTVLSAESQSEKELMKPLKTLLETMATPMIQMVGAGQVLTKGLKELVGALQENRSQAQIFQEFLTRLEELGPKLETDRATVLQDPQVLSPSEVEHKANHLQPRVSDLVEALSDLKRDLLLAGIAVTPTDDRDTLQLLKSTLGDFITRWEILQELTRLLVRALVSSDKRDINNFTMRIVLDHSVEQVAMFTGISSVTTCLWYEVPYCWRQLFQHLEDYREKMKHARKLFVETGAIGRHDKVKELMLPENDDMLRFLVEDPFPLLVNRGGTV